MPHGLIRRRRCSRLSAQRIVKSVGRVRVLGDLDIVSPLLKPFDIHLADGDRIIVIGRAGEDAYWPVGDVIVGEVGGHAVRVEGDIGRKFRA